MEQPRRGGEQCDRHAVWAGHLVEEQRWAVADADDDVPRPGADDGKGEPGVRREDVRAVLGWVLAADDGHHDVGEPGRAGCRSTGQERHHDRFS
ncbi:hypothetical protein AB0I90_04055 [Micromonospora wenchangensis]|uniref:hypothetical protein n=1 Tax=Micromonospora wenchangensis TaxID=1185415 RepID=UPI00340B2128